MNRYALREGAHDESGATLVIVAILVVVLLGFGAFAVDLGNAYAVKRQLSSTADSAALAGAQEAGLKYSAPLVGGCGPKLEELVTDAVNANHQANDPTGATGDPELDVTCFDKDDNEVTGTAATRVEVTVKEKSSLGTFFGGILGVDTLKPDATATAQVFGSRFLSGLRPFLVCTQDAKDARDLHELGSYPLFQSYYRKFEKTTAIEPAGLVHEGATWDEADDIITTGNKNHGLENGDYVRLVNLEASGALASEGEFYYVSDKSNKAFKVTTPDGLPVGIDTSGTVDVYKPAPDVASATWNGETVTATSHKLADNTEVWVQALSAVDPPADGSYTVALPEVNPENTFQLARGSGPEEESASINVYVLSTPNVASGNACSPPGSTGNWGYSAFDFTGGDNFQLACLIKYGYGGSSDGSGKPDGSECLDPDDKPGVDVGAESEGVPAEGDQGNNLGKADGALIKELIEAGYPILLPVGSNWNAQGGNNAEYDGRGALSVKLCGYVLPGNQVDPAAPALPAADQYYFGDGCGGFSEAQMADTYKASIVSGATDKDTTLVIQWVYEEWVFGFQGQPSSSAEQCPLGTCVASLQLLK